MDGWWGSARHKAQGKALNGLLFGQPRLLVLAVLLSLVGLLPRAVQAADDNMSPVDGSVQMVVHLSNGEGQAITFPSMDEVAPVTRCRPDLRDLPPLASENISAEQAELLHGLSTEFASPRVQLHPMLWVLDRGKLALDFAPDEIPGTEPEQWVPDGEASHFDKRWYLKLGWNFAPGRMAEYRRDTAITPLPSATILPGSGLDAIGRPIPCPSPEELIPQAQR
ncbi:hypothetical protein [Halomonas huangheensis]|uniref:Uncharacterized protein n=1 Tax=Halomonas huangheensis TaxID=1178482 RepID=W1N7H3_9GAMM|nr:hypothetical protein [Halomonas huangheensis]ALM54292.1 hypothetical protein AR456_19975 [Halomonas huangheensis]ERL50845.1 hypothetical protein BJB45_19810 [Halomonas huangheensis]